MHCFHKPRRSFSHMESALTLSAIVTGSLCSATPAIAAPPTPDTLISVCSGVSLPPSVVTGIMDPVLTGIYNPIETDLNQTLGVLSFLLGLPAPLNVDVSGLLTTAASGSDIGLNVIASDGTLVGPSDACNAQADSYTLNTPAGIAIGGNQITGLGAAGEQAVAGEIDSIAIGNRASTDATSADSIAIGPDAAVGTGADGAVAFGSNASVSQANSVALGANSAADRGAVSGVSVGEVSVGSPGNERQITNVAAATQGTDAVNLDQLNAAVAGGSVLAVLYDDSTYSTITLGGASGTTVTNVAPGALNVTSTDAVNGSQLYATNQQVDANTQAILNLQVSSGLGPNPIAYSNAGTPTTPNGGTPTNDATLVGSSAGPVALHNIADGEIAAGSTDAVNGGQIFDILDDLPDSVANAVTYDDGSHTSVTLNDGGAPAAVHNVADGTAPTDAVNVRQLDASHDDAVNIANSYTDNRITTLDQTLQSLDFDLRDAKRDARAGTAAALAAASLPQPSDPGRSMIAGGVGLYRGRVGFTIGGSYRATNGQSVYKVGVTYDSSSHVGLNAGAGIQF